MSEVNESAAWNGAFEGLLDEDDVREANAYSYSATSVDGGAPAVVEGGDWRFQVAEFAKGAAEMSVEFGKGVRDVVKQSILREDSIIMRKFKGPCLKILGKLRFLNEYRPEDRDPVHAWTVIASVCVFALAALLVTIETTTPSVEKMIVHPTSASLILLPDGRRLAYQKQGVQADKARYSIIVTHSFLSSRLAGIPGLKGSLLQEFGVRLVSYDLPGYGESDPHPDRDLKSSALDMLHLSYALKITGKFWVVGYSYGSKRAWAALHYIPDRLAGAIMVAPVVNPYEPRLAKDEKRRIWRRWTIKRKFMYFLAQKFPKLLPYFYRKSFLSGNHGPIDKWLSFSVGKRVVSVCSEPGDVSIIRPNLMRFEDRALIEDRSFQELWRRDVEESVQQGNAKPFVEEAVLKGAEDRVVPPAVSDFVHRALPDVMLHKLPHGGHLTYFYLCEKCHRQVFTIVFGNLQGPFAAEDDQIPSEDDDQVILSDTISDTEND